MSIDHHALPATAHPADPSDAGAGWLDLAVRVAEGNVAAGGGPFGAVIIRDGELIAQGVNEVTRTPDPTAHAEVTAIRAACRAVADFRLSDVTLYSSCEPCPMCLGAALWARIPRIVFAADREIAAKAGFDDSAFYELFHTPRDIWPLSIRRLEHPKAAAPFETWTGAVGRIDY